MKKIVAVLTILVLFLGGCSVVNDPKITKEQQNNVVIRVLRGYKNIESIEFIDFSKDMKTGFFNLTIQINGDSTKRVVLSSSDYKELNNPNGWIGLDPIEKYATLIREEPLDENEQVPLANIKIKYIGE